VTGYLARLLLEQIHAEKRRREERAKSVREAIAAAFEVAPGPVFCVRRQVVVAHVARTLGQTVINNAFHAEVARAARWLGMQPVKNGNRSLFRCAKRRDQDDGRALAESRAHRRDARWAVPTENAEAAG
jgi:hypothetical protein